MESHISDEGLESKHLLKKPKAFNFYEGDLRFKVGVSSVHIYFEHLGEGEGCEVDPRQLARGGEGGGGVVGEVPCPNPQPISKV